MSVMVEVIERHTGKLRKTVTVEEAAEQYTRLVPQPIERAKTALLQNKELGSLSWRFRPVFTNDYTVLIEVCKEFREAVLHGRHQLQEECLDSDQTNAVLELFDDTIGALLPEESK